MPQNPESNGASDDHDQRRRTLLRCLQAFDEPVSLPDIADEVAEREQGESIASISGERVRDVYLSLYHRHVPALANEGLIAYDQSADLVWIPEGVDPADVYDSDRKE